MSKIFIVEDEGAIADLESGSRKRWEHGASEGPGGGL